jgi:bifunctional DNase/RNase
MRVKRLVLRDIIVRMKRDFVLMTVRSVSVDEGEELPRVILREGDDRGGGFLSVDVGPFEASAILLELEGIAPPRPLTHDLLADFFRESGIDLERAELFGGQGTGPRARLVYRRGFIRRVKEVRPSDALALALRLKAPICAERELLRLPGRDGFPDGMKALSGGFAHTA